MIAIIPCAGRNSRFDYFAKALVRINRKKNIEILIKKIQLVVSEIIIVSDIRWKEDFEGVANIFTNVRIVIDDTYGGEAKAIRTAIEKENLDDDLLIVWGDTVYNSNTFLQTFVTETAHKPHCALHIPVRFENNPYLSILLDSRERPYDVSFSKETGHRQRTGWHDLSTFVLSRKALGYLNTIEISKSGEIKFLNIIKVLYAAKEEIKLYEFKGKEVLSFNTQEELNQILKLLAQQEPLE